MPKPAAKLAKNHHHSLEGGLHQDEDLLDEFVEMAAESAELDESDAECTDKCIAVAKEYDAALATALDELVVKYPPKDGATADDLWDAEAPYLVLMTLRGEGVGIWDGDWEDFYDDTKPVEEFLKSKLGHFADDTGGGTLNQAFDDAAFETCGDEEGDEDEDEEDDLEEDEDEEDDEDEDED